MHVQIIGIEWRFGFRPVTNQNLQVNAEWVAAWSLHLLLLASVDCMNLSCKPVLLRSRYPQTHKSDDRRQRPSSLSRSQIFWQTSEWCSHRFLGGAIRLSLVNSWSTILKGYQTLAIRDSERATSNDIQMGSVQKPMGVSLRCVSEYRWATSPWMVLVSTNTLALALASALTWICTSTSSGRARLSNRGQPSVSVCNQLGLHYIHFVTIVVPCFRTSLFQVRDVWNNYSIKTNITVFCHTYLALTHNIVHIVFAMK